MNKDALALFSIVNSSEKDVDGLSTTQKRRILRLNRDQKVKTRETSCTTVLSIMESWNKKPIRVCVKNWRGLNIYSMRNERKYCKGKNSSEARLRTLSLVMEILEKLAISCGWSSFQEDYTPFDLHNLILNYADNV